MWQELYKGVTICESPKRYVIFSEDVIEILKRYQQNTNDGLESGGLILGKIRGEHFEVTHLTTPQPKDKQNRFSFERNDPEHVKIMQKLKNSSNKEICYLGEWHTHPEDNPIPSGIDMHEWNSIRKKRKYQVIFLIIGRKNYFIE
ncbi:Mov34/MPN/PAD-1 family protein [Alkalispirochaeta alkalica]|uniref:Mov34/MPN/PAD-1 family protein n=1 Tax=Alkalispirochaeta alkalica TaxID=46356 RepID=UPI0012FE1800|nr:Mov34/MPN/PAD-1 family protein [Alkalispirochaeta alkalica]